MKYYKKKKMWKTIGIIAAVVVALLVIGFVANGANKSDDDYEKLNVGWTVGGLTETGRFNSEATDTMASDRVKIDGGFKIEPNFNAGLNFDVYFYDDNDTFLGTHENSGIEAILNMNASECEEGATYFRIVLHPNDDDDDINTFEKWKYQTQIKVFTLPVEDVDDNTAE